ncbi:MAG TPA: DUF1080 domain-containing protein, partial [Candidatus Hydrogenedentes bacterium]|nr:DUF1080 domain-containing protein [Candidatus Hydrogenedentota bacterium]
MKVLNFSLSLFVVALFSACAAMSDGAECTKAPEEGYVSLFNGKDLSGWMGDTAGYVVQKGAMVCKPGGNIFTEKEFSDFSFRS